MEFNSEIFQVTKISLSQFKLRIPARALSLVTASSSYVTCPLPTSPSTQAATVTTTTTTATTSVAATSTSTTTIWTTVMTIDNHHPHIYMSPKRRAPQRTMTNDGWQRSNDERRTTDVEGGEQQDDEQWTLWRWERAQTTRLALFGPLVSFFSYYLCF